MKRPSPKTWSLVVLVVIVFAGAIVTGATRFGPHHATASLVQSLLAIAAIYWWYSIDKRERQFKAGVFQNMGVVIFAPVALAIYFFRSRKLKSAALATLAMIAIFFALAFVLEAGESIGRALG